MKIIHAISSLNTSSGGPSLSTWNLITRLREKEIDAEIVTFRPQSNKDKMIGTGNFVHALQPNKFFSSFYSKELSDFFNVNHYSLYHGHGLWQLPVHYMVREAGNKNRPYIITPRGMLRPWALEQGKIKKKIALWLYQNNDLNNAACLHATAKIEADEIRALGFKNPIAVIPNGIDLSEYPLIEMQIQKTKKAILYLSRVYPKKGLENLIEAWSIIDRSLRKDWEISIAGNGDEKYVKQLQQLILNKELENEIKIIGAKYGQDKINTYQQADLFVLPTLGENFGMVVAEALACGVPVITTKGAPWEELNTKNAGWWIDIGVEPLAKALTEAMQLSDNYRKRMGLNGRKLVEEKYSIDSVAEKMIQLYEWILNKKEKPDFVYG